jgi:hypothetical protein
MSAWGSSAKPTGISTKLTDIMSEQAIEKETMEDGGLTDYELALKLQFEDEFIESDDLELVHALSAIDEFTLTCPLSQAAIDPSLKYSKITVKSQYESNDSQKKKPLIVSSSFNEAVHQVRKVEHLDEARLNYITTHDPLLSALSTSESLTEWEGVGDLSGSGLLVNKKVAHPLRSFMQHQQKQKTEDAALTKRKKK